VKPLFLDTGYVIALEAADDQQHEEAIKHWRGLLRKLPILVTTTYVVNEIAPFSTAATGTPKPSKSSTAS
jgi:predicted nucleic acid-binding protein